MKSTLFITFISVMLFSCSKKNDLVINQAAEKSSAPEQSSRIRWSDLPAELREAVSVNTHTSENALRTDRSALEIIETFGPYGGIKGSSFGIFPSIGSHVTAIGLGDDGRSTVKNLTIWYITSTGTLIKAQAGEVSDEDVIDFRLLSTDEYILGVSGRKQTYLTQLTIKTNKNNTVSAGGTNGTKFSAATTPGNWVFGFWGYATTGRIYQVNFDIHCKPWVKQNGSDGHDIAVAPNGTSYLTNTYYLEGVIKGDLYKMPATETTWTWIRGDVEYIAANGGRVCYTHRGKIYELFGNTPKQLPGSDAVDIAIASDKRIWITNTDGEIYRYNDNASSWELMPGSDAVRIAAGKNQIWMINTEGKIYKWNGSSWTRKTGGDGKDIAVANDGNVWLTNTDGILYRWNGSSWDELCGSNGHTIACNDKKIMMVNTAGKFTNLLTKYHVISSNAPFNYLL